MVPPGSALTQLRANVQQTPAKVDRADVDAPEPPDARARSSAAGTRNITAYRHRVPTWAGRAPPSDVCKSHSEPHLALRQPGGRKAEDVEDSPGSATDREHGENREKCVHPLTRFAGSVEGLLSARKPARPHPDCRRSGTWPPCEAHRWRPPQRSQAERHIAGGRPVWRSPTFGAETAQASRVQPHHRRWCLQYRSRESYPPWWAYRRVHGWQD